jgi:hypothetical protein
MNKIDSIYYQIDPIQPTNDPHADPTSFHEIVAKICIPSIYE